MSRNEIHASALILAAVFLPAVHAQFTQQGNKLLGIGAAGAATQGDSIAVSSDGNTLAVGGSSDNALVGAVWVYTRSNGVYTQQGSKLVGNGSVGGSSQGFAVSISADGNTLIEGGPSDGPGGTTGAAWIFTRTGGVWTQQGGKLVGLGAFGGAEQGIYVAISGDGNTAIVGGSLDNGNVGAAWVFTRAAGVWTQQAKLVGIGASGQSQQGNSVALSSDGNTALVGAPGDSSNLGAAWVFTRTGASWGQQSKLVGTGSASPGINGVLEGYAVSLSSDGNTALFGGPGDSQNVGAAWVFTRNSGLWTQQGSKLVGSGTLGKTTQGSAVSLSGDGNAAVLGGPSDNFISGLDATGAVWVFRRSGGAWSQFGGKLVGGGGIHGTLGIEADGPQQGRSVDISSDGSTLAVGGNGDASNAGAAWVFALPRFSFTTPTTATGGTAFNFTVSALDANNQLVANYPGTLHFTSSDPSATLPADSILSNGVLNPSATLRTGGPQTISAVDTANSGDNGTSAAITVSGVAVTPPNPVSVTPFSGNAATATYQFVFNDPRGVQDLNVVNVLVNNFLDARRACYLAYSVPSSTLFLVDDAGDAGGPFAGAVVNGSLSAIANSQCSVILVSATSAGNTLTLVMAFTWSTSFAGDKIINLAARDLAANNSGFYPLGVWRVPGGTQTTTTAVTAASPARGTGLGLTTFTFSFSDTKGFQDLGVENVLVNNSLDGRHACYVAYARPANLLFLVNDNGDGLLAGQSLAAAGSIGNSQCTVSWGAAPVAGSGNNLILTLNIAFTASFAGNRIIYVATRDINELNNTDWHAMGTWTPQ